MGDLRMCSRAFIAEFIDMYKCLPCLWNMKSIDYRNRKKKGRAYEKLILKLREIEPDATRDTVTKKINSLRSCYRKEKKKIEASKIGDGYDEVHVPNLWYFDLLTFLDDQDIPNESLYNIDDNDEMMIEEALSTAGSEDRSPQLDDEIEVTYDSVLSPGSTSSEQAPKKKSYARTGRKRRSIQQENAGLELIKDIGERMKIIKPQNKIDYATKSWACSLKSLPREQQLFAMKVINEVIFEAEMGNLSREATLVIKPESRTNASGISKYE